MKEAFGGVASMAPLATASSMWAVMVLTAAAEMTGPTVVVWSVGSPRTYLDCQLCSDVR